MGGLFRSVKEEAKRAAEAIRATVVHDIDRYNSLQQIAKSLLQNREPLRRDIMKALSVSLDVAGRSEFAGELREYYKIEGVIQ